MKSYRDLDIYKESFRLAITVHRMSLNLPKYECYELGSQVRRSSKSIVFNVVEGFGRKRYKKEFIRFVIFAHASCEEVQVQLNMITELYKQKDDLKKVSKEYQILSKRIWKFLNYLDNEWIE